jgi:hypothetical protein
LHIRFGSAKQLFFEKQYLFVIGQFSPFLRSISGEKSRLMSNCKYPEDTSSGKVYITRCCNSLGCDARQKDYSLCWCARAARSMNNLEAHATRLRPISLS